MARHVCQGKGDGYVHCCVFMKAASIGTEMRKRRWAAGYNVVRARDTDRRFMFSHYPDSKDANVVLAFDIEHELA